MILNNLVQITNQKYTMNLRKQDSHYLKISILDINHSTNFVQQNQWYVIGDKLVQRAADDCHVYGS